MYSRGEGRREDRVNWEYTQSVSHYTTDMPYNLLSRHFCFGRNLKNFFWYKGGNALRSSPPPLDEMYATAFVSCMQVNYLPPWHSIPNDFSLTRLYCKGEVGVTMQRFPCKTRQNVQFFCAFWNLILWLHP